MDPQTACNSGVIAAGHENSDQQQQIRWAALLFFYIRALDEDTSCMMKQHLQAWMDFSTQAICGADSRATRVPNLWKYDRVSIMEVSLLHSYDDRMFKSRVRISRATFNYIFEMLAPLLKHEDTRMRKAISVETRIFLALSRLATGNCLKDIADTYGVGYTTAQRVVSEFCHAMKVKLHDLCIKWPSMGRMDSIAKDFEKLKGIPFVVGAIDGSHLPIIAPTEHPQDYYNRKGFHSILLQVIVDSKGCVWDYDVGWAGSLHDWNLFEKSAAGKRIKAGHLGHYCLIGDAAYPPRPWMLSPYKGHKNGLTKVEANWNYIQSSTRMTVECAFGMLKSRFRILLKRNDTKLDNVPEIVSTCLVLHNLCLRHGDDFDMEWKLEAEVELKDALESENRRKVLASRVKRMKIPESEVARAASYGLYRVQGVLLDPMEALVRAVDDDPKEIEHLIEDMPKTHAKISAANQERRNALAKVLYENLGRKPHGDTGQSSEYESE